MVDSTFDPESFMQQEMTGQMETRYTPVPANDYTSTIDDVVVRETADGTKILDVTHLIHDSQLAEDMGMEKLFVRQGIFLDIEPGGNIAIGPNKNVKLGRLREAVGQNTPSTWSFGLLKGAGPLRISVSIKPDKEDPSIQYNRVDKTLPLEPGQ